MRKSYFYFSLIFFQLLLFSIVSASEKKDTILTPSAETIPQSIREINNQLHICLEKAVMGAILTIAKRGGYLMPPVGADTSAIPRYIYINERNTPTKENLEKHMTIFTKQKLDQSLCLDSFRKIPGLSMNPGGATIHISMEIDKVNAKIDYPIIIRKNEFVYEAKEPYWVEIPCKIMNMHAISIEIVEQKMKDPKMTCISCLASLASKNDVKINFIDTSGGQTFTIRDDKSRYFGEPLIFIFGIEDRHKD